MNQRTNLVKWYTRAPSSSHGSKSVIEEAFQDAKARFEHDSVKDPQRLELTRSKTEFDDVKAAVQIAKEAYETGRKNSKVQKWLNRLSQRIHFYGGVLDVLAQHHLEYVALAWGTIKFLLIVVTNREKIVTTLAKAIAQIAEVLPRVNLKTSLYPTDRMKEALTNLYVSIFQFFSRAREWCEESGLRRFQAEIRDMHYKFEIMTATIERINTTVSLLHALKVPQEEEISQPSQVSTIDILKYLVRQAINVRRAFDEKSMALRCATFYSATSEREWFQLLESILVEYGRQIYIVIDLELLDKHLKPLENFSWIQQFQAFFSDMTARGLATKVKVIMFCGASKDASGYSTAEKVWERPAVTADIRIPAERVKEGLGLKYVCRNFMIFILTLVDNITI
ncbi:hypothetical protein GQ44DRAFT_828992 [Phaeosphaeriaceae sp. PMI808]|nr:hypothetical protein GQ44DRAFT_828992 [Phaeosphaeriaceae sp. PMI808]